MLEGYLSYETTYLTFVFQEVSWVNSISWKVYWADLRGDYNETVWPDKYRQMSVKVA